MCSRVGASAVLHTLAGERCSKAGTLAEVHNSGGPDGGLGSAPGLQPLYTGRRPDYCER